MKKRLSLKCWNCAGAFELTLDLSGSPIFLKECPFCGAECQIDLNPCRESTTGVYKGNAANTAGVAYQWRFPREIVTTAPQKNGPDKED